MNEWMNNILADRQTYITITILRNRFCGCGQSNKITQHAEVKNTHNVTAVIIDRRGHDGRH